MEKVAKVGDVKDKLCVSLNGKKLALFKIKGKFYCIDNKCSHAGGPLCEGNLDGKTITCPWHYSKFDVTTGKATGPPAQKDVGSYKVTVKGDDIFVSA